MWRCMLNSVVVSSNESGVVLSSISFDLASGRDMELWKTVLRQLHLEEMPPTKSEQPEQHERDAVMLWINAELRKSGNDSDLYTKLESPSFGNYVNHEKLFRKTANDGDNAEAVSSLVFD